MRFLVKSFLQGLLVLAPLLATGYAVIWVVRKMDEITGSTIPGLGLVLSLAGIVVVGWLTTSVLGNAVAGALDHLMRRLPLVKLLYTALADLINAFVGDNRKFDRPVVVTLAEQGGAKALGFITQDDTAFTGLEGHVAVYFPQSYNFAGMTLLFPRDRVQPVDAPSSDFMRFIVSGGVSSESTAPTPAPATPR